MRLLLTLLPLACALGLHAQQAPGDPTLSATVNPPAKEKFHLYLLMGQSNMAGRDTRNLAAQTPDPRVLAMTPDGKWVVAKDPIHQKDGRIEPGAGPGIPFALAMLKANSTDVIGLVPCAVAGTPLRRWEKGADLYKRALERAKLAAQSGVITGALWHQGESDTNKQSDAETYQARLSKMIKDLRQDLGRPDLPVVVGQIGMFLAPEKYPFVDTVRASIRKVAETVPNVGYADSADLTDKGDKLHFSAEAQRQFGGRYADGMKKLGPAGP